MFEHPIKQGNKMSSLAIIKSENTADISKYLSFNSHLKNKLDHGKFCSLGGKIDEKTIMIDYMTFNVVSTNKAAIDVLNCLNSNDFNIVDYKKKLSLGPKVTVEDVYGNKFTLSLKAKHVQYNLTDGNSFSENFFMEFGWLECKFNHNLRLCWFLEQG